MRRDEVRTREGAPVNVAVVAEFYPRAHDPVLGIWAHRQALAARDAGADVRVLVLHRPIPPLATAPRARGRETLRLLRQPRRATLDGIEVELRAASSSPPRAAHLRVLGRVGGPAAGGRAAAPAPRASRSTSSTPTTPSRRRRRPPRADRRAARRLRARRRRLPHRPSRRRPGGGRGARSPRRGSCSPTAPGSSGARRALGARAHARRAPRHRPAAAGARRPPAGAAAARHRRAPRRAQAPRRRAARARALRDRRPTCATSWSATAPSAPRSRASRAELGVARPRRARRPARPRRGGAPRPRGRRSSSCRASTRPSASPTWRRWRPACPPSASRASRGRRSSPPPAGASGSSRPATSRRSPRELRRSLEDARAAPRARRRRARDGRGAFTWERCGRETVARLRGRPAMTPAARSSFVTNPVPPDRVGAFAALHEREGIELALFGGRSHHATGGVADPGVPAPPTSPQREVHALAAAAATAPSSPARPAAWRCPPPGAARAARGMPFVLWSALWAAPPHAGARPRRRRCGRDLPRRRRRRRLRPARRPLRARHGRAPRDDRAAGRRHAFWSAPGARRPRAGAVHRRSSPAARRRRRASRSCSPPGARRPRPSRAALVLAGAGHDRRRGRRRGRVAGPLPPAACATSTRRRRLAIPSVPSRASWSHGGWAPTRPCTSDCAVIATDAVGAAAGGLVRDGRTGLVVPPATPPRSPPRSGACTTIRRCANASARQARRRHGLHLRGLGGGFSRPWRRGAAAAASVGGRSARIRRCAAACDASFALASPCSSPPRAGGRARRATPDRRLPRRRRVDGTYSQRELQKALDQPAADIDQYTDCRDVHPPGAARRAGAPRPAGGTGAGTAGSAGRRRRRLRRAAARQRAAPARAPTADAAGRRKARRRERPRATRPRRRSPAQPVRPGGPRQRRRAGDAAHSALSCSSPRSPPARCSAGATSRWTVSSLAASA